MYESYYGLKQKPFENTPDPEFFFESREAREALLRLEYGVENRKGGLLLVGDYGCGKTMLVRKLLAKRLATGAQDVAFLANPVLRPVELLREIYYQFTGKMLRGGKLAVRREIESFFYAAAQHGQAPVLVIDEAQSMPRTDLAEEVRLLLNFQTDKEFLFTLLLCGQPEVIRLLEGVPQLLQRLAIRYRLRPLAADEVRPYILWRFRAAGLEGDIPIQDDAIEAVARFSRGNPRVINGLCDFALFAGTRLDRKTIDGALMEQLCREFDGATVL